VGDRKLPPFRTFLSSDSESRDILRTHRVIAAVGLDPDITRQMRQYGYRVLEFNSAIDLSQASEPCGIVCIADAAADIGALVGASITAGARVIWMNAGVAAPQQAYFAHRNGLQVVMNRCIRREYEEHFSELDEE